MNSRSVRTFAYILEKGLQHRKRNLSGRKGCRILGDNKGISVWHAGVGSATFPVGIRNVS